MTGILTAVGAKPTVPFVPRPVLPYPTATEEDPFQPPGPTPVKDPAARVSIVDEELMMMTVSSRVVVEFVLYTVNVELRLSSCVLGTGVTKKVAVRVMMNPVTVGVFPPNQEVVPFTSM